MKGGDISKPGAMEGEFDATRTGETRAMDVVLSKARIGTRLQIDVHDPILDAQTETISAVFLNDALRATGGRAKLRVASKPRLNVSHAIINAQYSCGNEMCLCGEQG